ncbi:hypothetical protein FA95DRAFT_1684150 [Auriscalpium vulgare]|uniref:Uncharacterized protein n=1 Tax=Auriscalpium vulgare TaxID=40419 RepID=A0ACB8R7I0_9AGAM|nr:hypothetical protein FA95DRAFT_1684150 [Auriscalpium vulgare]
MAPFFAASEIHPGPVPSGTKDGVYVYHGNADPDWAVHAVPQGGYVLALIIRACIEHQVRSHTPDPIHVTAHYLRKASLGPLEVHIRAVRTGRTLSNLTADLIQTGVVVMTTHLVFGILNASTLPPPSFPLTLEPPSPHARVTPFSTHPSESANCPLAFPCPGVTATVDGTLGTLPNPSGGVDVGQWFTFSHPADMLTLPSLAFFSDLFPNLLPPVVAGGKLPASSCPTVVLTLEFKAPIPRGARTVGAYAVSRFLNDPQGRHDVYGELWTAPEGEDNGDNWRQKQRCLAVSHQTALVIPMALKRDGKSRL